MVPSVDECYQLMDQYGMLDNIRAHSIVVAKVAFFLGRELNHSGAHLSLNAVSAGALMHDIGKSLCLHSPEDHAAKGEEICLRHDLEEISGIVGEHIRLKEFMPHSEITEKEIVYYADKRVNNDQVVSLAERLDYLIERYALHRDHLEFLIRKNFDLCKEVEKKIFLRLSFRPTEIGDMIG